MKNFVASLSVFGLGILIIFVGIGILICCVILQKYFTIFLQDYLKNSAKKKEFKKSKKKSLLTKEIAETTNFPVNDNSEISLEIKLAIIAAISAYYENNTTECEFKVKRIKRLA
jgi:hypothetical protein